jgi:hypothetical protein
MLRKLLVLSVGCVWSLAAMAQSAVDGVWNFAMNSPMGSVSAVVTMKAEGEKLTGEFDLGNGRKWTIDNGVVSGNDVSFSITRDGSSFTYEMKATIVGDSAEGVAMAMGSEAPWSMTRQ